MLSDLDVPSSAVQPFLDWLESDSEQLVHVMYDAVVAATPSVLGCATGQAGLRAALTSHLPLVHAVVGAGDGQPAFELPPAASRWARQMAVERIELSDLIQAYDAAGDALLRTFARSMRADASRLLDEQRADALEIGMERLLRYLRAALGRAISAYTQERELLRRRDDSRALAAVRGALAGEVDESAAETELSYRFTANHWGFAIWCERPGGADLDRVVPLLRAAVHPWQHVAVPDGRGGLIGWMSTSHPDPAGALAALALPPGVHVALGTRHHGLAGFRSTHKEAQETRRVLGVAPRASSVVSFLDVAVRAMSSHDTELVTSFVTGRLGPLLSDRHADLLRTLEIWLAELGSPTRASRRLGVHTNTVVKRLERIQGLLGGVVDPGSLTLRVAVELAPLAVAPPSR